MAIKTAQKQLETLVHDLATQGLCNEQAYDFKSWQEKREGQDYTCIAYSQGRYGTIASLYYMKGSKVFAYV